MEAKIEAAKQAKADVEAELLKIPGVNAVDIGYKYVDGKRTDEIAIRVHVKKKKKTVDPKEKIPEEINGIKTDVIEGTYEPFVVAKKQVINAEPEADTLRYRPLKGGVSIGPDRSVGGSIFAGTLGCMVKDNATGKVMMLSNFHVMCIDNTWHVGDQLDQPSLIDTGTHADGVGTLARAVLSNHVDGAIANINAGITAPATIADIGNVNGTATAVLGAAVRKRGRTTLLTYGFIDGLSGTVNINYGGAIGTRTLQDQITIRPDTTRNPMFSDHGDSGSAIVDSANNVIALLFAGSTTNTIANPIAFVEAELNVKVAKYLQVVVPKARFDTKAIFKEVKHEKLEKLEIFEKLFENPIPKLFENPAPGSPITGGGGGLGDGESSSLEQRIAGLEYNLATLTSFIGEALRPDLSKGALSNE